MRNDSPRWSLAALVGALIAGLLVTSLVPPARPAHAQSSTLDGIRDRLREVRAERDRIEERITEVTVAFERLRARISDLEQERDELRADRAELRAELDVLDELVRFRVRETFKHGAALDPIAVFLGSSDPSAAFSRAQTIQRLVAGDQASSEELVAARARVTAADLRLAEQGQELDDAVAEQAELAERLQAEFAALQATEDDLTADERAELARIERERRERAERERLAREARERRAREAAQAARATATSPSRSTAPAASTGTGGMACPLDQPRSFIDSWGYARSGGRRHRGTDIMGPLGIPVRAITSGTWSIQRVGRSAGIWGILRGDNGHQYWYLHLNSHTVGNGTRVSAGQQVGTNGSTGNATRGAEHIHFEYHPGGGSAVNPYPLLRSVC